nr:MAG TPA: hypothetical protein [Caudoviricetes sp.]
MVPFLLRNNKLFRFSVPAASNTFFLAAGML